ncbi:MAG: glycosyltransferase family 4 protein [Colwellia sp.]|nr:glycosyltransferase family 4 protein [Colwellia sp.]
MNNELVVVLSALPPPMGGAAKNTKIIADALKSKIQTDIINTSVGNLAHDRSLTYHLRRISKTLSCVYKLLRLSKTNKKTLYIVPDGGLGMIYTLMYFIAARLCNYNVFLHHRTFLYIDKYSSLMFLAKKILQGKESHIFLSPGMLKKYELQYGVIGSKFISDNSRYVIPDSQSFDIPNKLILGHLSNLCDEKGFYEVIETFEKLADKNPEVYLKIAGKPLNEEVQLRLSLLIEQWGDRIEHLGHIDGKEKDKFYQSLDVFLFPTKFKQEAQPNVIYEAMAKGCACASWGRACVPEMYTSAVGIVVPVNEDFVTKTTEFIENIITNRSLLLELKNNALFEIKNQKKKAEIDFNIFINAIVNK